VGRPDKKCHNCGKMHGSDKFVHCKPCREVRRARSKQVMLDTLAEGFCTSCRKVEAEPGITRCLGCSEKWKTTWHARRAAAIAAGNCSKCFKVPCRDGFKYCQRCAHRMTRWTKAWRRRNKVQVRDAVRDIISALQAGRELALIELAKEAGISTRTVLRHAPKLVEQGIMERRLDGFKAFYSGGRNLWANV
jgi:DNA-binding transcriptional ArsR family regulator